MAISEPAVLPQGAKVIMHFTITDVRSGCKPLSTQIEFAVQPPDLYQTTALMKKSALDDLAKGDADEGLKTLGVLIIASLSAPPTPPPPPVLGNITQSNPEASPEPTEPPGPTAQEEGEAMEKRDSLVDTLGAILVNNQATITEDQANLIVSTMGLVTGGDTPAPMSTATCEKAAGTLLALSGTGKVSADKTDSFATAASNILSNIGGKTRPVHNSTATQVDAKQTQAVVSQLTKAVESVLVNLLPPLDATGPVVTKPVVAKSPDGAFYAVAQRAACEPSTQITNANVTFSTPLSWRTDCDGAADDPGTSGRRRRGTLSLDTCDCGLLSPPLR